MLLAFVFGLTQLSVAQTLTISDGGQTGTSGTNWSATGTNPVIITATGTATINTSVVESYLNTGTSVLVVGDQISVSNDIEKTAGGEATITFRAAGDDISEEGRLLVYSNITSSSGALNIICWSDYNNHNKGGVSIFSGNTINTNGGHLWCGGSETTQGSTSWNGLTVGDGPSVGSDGNNFNALDFYDVDLNTEGGDVFLWAAQGFSAGTNGLAFNGTTGEINSGTGDVILVSDAFAGGTTITSTGHLYLAPHDGAYPSAVTWSHNSGSPNINMSGTFDALNINAFNNLGGLTIGEYEGMTGVDFSNSSDVTISSATTIAGPVSVYGRRVDISADVQSTQANEAITFVAKGFDMAGLTSGLIALATNTDLTTNGGNIVLWSNAENLTTGQKNNELILVGTNVLTSNGGKIVLAGGLDNGANGGVASDGIPDGYAYRGSYIGEAVDIRTNVTLDSDGGEIIIRGEQNGTDAAIGTDATFTIANAGNVTIEGENTSGNSVRLGTSNITSTTANADILLKGTGAISVAASSTLQTNNGDIILWSDSEGGGEGHIEVANGVTFNSANGSTSSNLSGGGNIVLAGGLDDASNGGTAADGYPDGFASSNTNPGVELNTDNTGDISFYSGGGDVVINGYSSALGGAVGIQQYGGLTINVGEGRMRINAESETGYGINFNQNAADSSLELELISAATSGDAIYINAISNASLGLVFNYSSFKELKATNGGNISLNGTGGSGNAGIFAQTLSVLANTGDIVLNGGTNGIFNKNTGNTYGAKAGTDITASTSDIIFRGDAISVEGGGTAVSFNTTGTVTLEPSGDDFTNAFTYSNLNLQSDVSGLTIGKAGTSSDGTSDADVTIGSATTIAGPISVYGGDITVSENLISTAINEDILLKGTLNVTVAASRTIQTNGGEIIFWSDSDNTGVTLSTPENISENAGAILVNDGASILSNGGNITLGGGAGTSTPTGNAQGTDIDTGGSGIFAGIELDNVSVSSSGGNISLSGTGAHKNNASTGLYLYGNTSINSGSGTITMYGESQAFENSTTGLRNGINLNNVNLTSTKTDSDAIILNGQSGYVNSGGTGSDREALSFSSVTINASGDVTFAGDVQVFSASSLSTTGALSITSYENNSFESDFVWSGAGSDFVGTGSINGLTIYDIANLSGLTIGKSTNNSNVTINSATSIAGPISVYGETIAVNENLNTTQGAAAGDVKLNAAGNITLAQNKNITTDGGDVIFKADADANRLGGIRIGTDFSPSTTTAITTNGGDIILSGGSDPLTGFASYDAGLGAAQSNYNYAIGVFGATLDASGTSSGGDIIVRGNGGNTFNGILWTVNIGGQYGPNTNVKTNGAGTISITSDMADVPANPTPNDSRNPWAVVIPGTIETENGNLLMVGKSTIARTNARGFALSGSFQSVSGTITIEDQTLNTNNVNYTGPFINGVKIGKGTLPASSSNVIFKADKFAFANNSAVETSGAVTLEPLEDDFASAFSFTIADLSLDGAISGLTIGKSATSADGTNDANVTIAGATTIAGPINIYGGDIAINGTLTATSDDIHLHSTGAVTQSAALTANGLSLNGTGTFTLTNTSNNIVTIAGGNEVTALGSVNFVDASGNLTIGTVNGENGITATGGVLVETLVGNINLTEPVSSLSSTDDLTGYAGAIVLNAGKSIAASTSTGGDILVSSNGAVTAANGITKLYSGSDANSTGLNTLVGGSANNRAPVDLNTVNFTPALTSGGKFALYRSCETVNAGTLSGNQAICTSGTTTFVSDGDAGGTWTSDDTDVATVDANGEITAVAAGTATITYVLTGAGGCPNDDATRTVTVTALDDASFAYSSSAYCADASDPTPTITGLAGGTFSSTAGLSINTSTGVIDVSASTPGTYTVTYTTAGTCPNSSDVSVTINALDDASFSYSSAAYCVDASDPTPTITGLEGGTFSSTAGLSINTSTGAIDISESTLGTYTVTYTTAGTCPNSSGVSVTINAIDDASFAYSSSAYCADASDPTPTITGVAGGAFSSTAGLSINTSTGVIDVSASTLGTYTVTYATAGTCPNSSGVSVTINAIDDASFSYASAAYCVDASDPTPTITGLAGGAFSATAGLSINASTGVIDVSASTPGTYTVTYTTAGTCPNSSGVSVTVNALDDASFSYNNSTFEVSASDPLPTVTGNPGGSFTSSTGLSIDGNSGLIDLSESTLGTYLVTYTTSGPCVNSSTFELTIENTLSVTRPTLDLSSLALYPNPVTSTLYINNPNQIVIQSIWIYDLRGRLVKNMRLNNNNMFNPTINVTSFESANYIIKIITKDSRQIVVRFTKR